MLNKKADLHGNVCILWDLLFLHCRWDIFLVVVKAVMIYINYYCKIIKSKEKYHPELFTDIGLTVTYFLIVLYCNDVEQCFLFKKLHCE